MNQTLEQQFADTPFRVRLNLSTAKFDSIAQGAEIDWQLALDAAGIHWTALGRGVYQLRLGDVAKAKEIASKIGFTILLG